MTLGRFELELSASLDRQVADAAHERVLLMVEEMNEQHAKDVLARVKAEYSRMGLHGEVVAEFR